MRDRISAGLMICAAALLLCGASPARGADELRDPFWPVDYEPTAPQRVQGEEPEEQESLLDLSKLSAEEQAIIKAHMRVGGILEQGSQRFAIINSDIVAEGEELALRVTGRVYRFLIKSLKPRQIVLEPIQPNLEPELE